MERRYNFAKTAGEKKVWELSEGKPWTCAAINPSMVFGPCLAKPHAKASPYVFRQALFGNPQPNQPYSCVDVRDVAVRSLIPWFRGCGLMRRWMADVQAAHVEAMVRPEANGKRFILDDSEPSVHVVDIIQQCRELFPDIQFDDPPGPTSWDEKLFGKKPSRSGTDNSQSREVLGIEYRPLEETIRDSVSSIVDNGFVPARPVAKL